MEKILLKDIWNKCKFINGVNIAGVMWFDNAYMVIREGETFEQVSERTYTPIKEFRLLSELNKYINRNITKKQFRKAVKALKREKITDITVK